jgi:hypothetical protein
MAVTMKNAVFWDVTPVALVRTDVSDECRSSKYLHDNTFQKTALFLLQEDWFGCPHSPLGNAATIVCIQANTFSSSTFISSIIVSVL